MKLGILGGGQLGMMMCQEAKDLKISTFIFTDTEDSPATKFSDEHIIAQYDDFEKLEKLYSEKKIMDHGLEVGKQIAFVLSGGNTNLNSDLSEDDLYNLELEAFMRLIQMPKTQERIKHTLETGKPLVN